MMQKEFNVFEHLCSSAEIPLEVNKKRHYNI